MILVALRIWCVHSTYKKTDKENCIESAIIVGQKIVV